MQSKAPLSCRSAGITSAKLCQPRSNLGLCVRAQLIESPPASSDQSFAARQQTAARRQQTASALTVGVSERAVLDAAPAIEASSSGSGSAADEALLRALTYGANAGVLGSVAMAAASGSGVLDIGDFHGLQAYGSTLHDAYLGLIGGHPVGLKVRVPGRTAVSAAVSASQSIGLRGAL